MAIIQSFFGKSIPETCGNCLQHKGCKNPCITYSGKGKEKYLLLENIHPVQKIEIMNSFLEIQEEFFDNN